MHKIAQAKAQNELPKINKRMDSEDKDIKAHEDSHLHADACLDQRRCDATN